MKDGGVNVEAVEPIVYHEGDLVTKDVDNVVESSPNDIMIREDENDSNLPENDVVGYDKDLIEARRIRQLEMRFAGYRPYKDIYPILSKEFHCDVESLHHDWNTREKWIANAAKLADVDSIMAETKVTGDIAQLRVREATKAIYDEMRRHVDEEGNPDWSDPVVPLLYGFLKDYLKGTMEITTAQIKNLTKLGILKEEPKRMQIEEKSLNVNINAFDVLDESDRMRLFGALFEGGRDDKDTME